LWPRMTWIASRIRSRGSDTASASGSVIARPATPFSGLFCGPDFLCQMQLCKHSITTRSPRKEVELSHPNSPGATGRLSPLSLLGSERPVRGPWLPDGLRCPAAGEFGCQTKCRCLAAWEKPMSAVASPARRVLFAELRGVVRSARGAARRVAFGRAHRARPL
jgi:hypothetical protein